MFFNRSGQEQVRRYAIKKLSVGVASVCVGIGLAVCLPVACFCRGYVRGKPAAAY
ncbi:YSIRK-type signal peptide-containing protein [Streptococcus equi]|uniref:YSIRK-type signal peptide-containing protein n=1 Tax=Streptococcus equi TaxID=1336 RepID=UPI001E5190C1|nr:YSIRK-type signal peptide-containing protein [Streptococcus equi]